MVIIDNNIIAKLILPAYSHVTNQSKISTLMPSAFQPGNLWFWSFPSAGKETATNYRINSLGMQFAKPPFRLSRALSVTKSQETYAGNFLVGNACGDNGKTGRGVTRMF